MAHQSFKLWLLLLSCGGIFVASLDNGLALAPPMGWNAWNSFGCERIDERVVLEAARILIDKGLDKLGYVHVNIDDCWSAPQRTDQDRLIGDSRKFPHGMQWVGDALHTRGLKFGIYSSAGTHTCAGYPASLGYETVDAQTFADWGVDYLKYDNCYNQGLPSLPRYVAMRNALNATGRPILYSACQWGHESPWQWAPAVANVWRTDGDMRATWRSIKRNFFKTMRHFEAAHPGAWLDPDMLQVGNGKLRYEENKAHFSLWCLIKAPLLLGNDLSRMPDNVWQVIGNPDLIQLNQDVATPIATQMHGETNDDGEYDFAIYATIVGGKSKDSGDFEMVAIFINWGEFPRAATTMDLSQILGLVPFPNQRVTVKDLWTNRTVTPSSSSSTVHHVPFGNSEASDYFALDKLQSFPVPPLQDHACVVYRFTLTTTGTPRAAAAHAQAERKSRDSHASVRTGKQERGGN